MVVSIFFNYFHPYLGKISNSTNIFEMGWNHQLVLFLTSLISTSIYRFGRFKCNVSYVIPIEMILFICRLALILGLNKSSLSVINIDLVSTCHEEPWDWQLLHSILYRIKHDMWFWICFSSFLHEVEDHVRKIQFYIQFPRSPGLAETGKNLIPSSAGWGT